MIERKLGATGPTVSAVGLGCMGMSDLYGVPQDRSDSIATIHAALDAGVTLIDTGDFYGMGRNEMLIADAIQGRRRETMTLSVKFGMQRGPGGEWFAPDGRPEAVKTSLAYTLKRLGTDYVDIYRPARLDPKVPIEDTVGAIADLIQAGYVRYIGLSEVGPDTLRRAASVHPISDLQIEYSLFARGIEADILPALRELGIGLTAYGTFARGLLTGTWVKQALSSGDFRSTVPWFHEENIDANLILVEKLRTFATGKHLTVAELALAWVLSQGDDVVGVVGAMSPSQVAEAGRSLRAILSQDELSELERLVPANAVAGARASGEQLRILDSEAS
mgnify:CR=1 FL=1